MLHTHLNQFETILEVINMTPHAIVLSTTVWDEMNFTHGDDHNITTIRTFEPSGSVVRLDYESKITGELSGFPVMSNALIGHNLPDTKADVYLLVSAMVLAAFPERNDLVAPDTNRASRNEKGHIVSVPGFVR